MLRPAQPPLTVWAARTFGTAAHSLTTLRDNPDGVPTRLLVSHVRADSPTLGTADRAFLETREYNGNLYGTPRSFIDATLAEGYDVILKPEVNGALAIRRSYESAVLIFLLPDKFSLLPMRLAARRTESSDEIAARLAIAHDELKQIRNFDYVIINEQAPPDRRDHLVANCCVDH